MANRTVIELSRRRDIVFLYQSTTQGELLLGRHPAHRKYFLARPDVLFWIPVTLQAPNHEHRLCLPGKRHPVYPAMTGFAAYPFGYVDLMIEKSEIGYVMDSKPFDRQSGTKTLADWLQGRRLGPYLAVAGHASMGRWNIGKCGYLDSGVAVAAIDAQAGNMVFVTELDRLFYGYVNGRDIR